MKRNNSFFKHSVVLIFLLLSALQAGAQRLQITRFAEDNSDLTARQETTGKKDINGELCGLIRVQFVGGNMTFESKNIKEVEQSTSEYLVWMNPKATKLTIKVPGYLPLNINFKKEHGLKEGIKSKTTYVMVIEGPQDKNAGKAYLTFHSKNGEGCTIHLTGTGGFDETYTTDKNGDVLNLSLPYGTYSYTASKSGFHTNSGKVTLTDVPVTEQIDLNSVTGRLDVKTQETAILYIDGQKQENHYATLPTGQHTIEVRFGTYSRTETINLPSSGLEVDMNMLGSLTITSPKGADLRVVAEEGAQQLNKNNYTTQEQISDMLGKYKVSVSKRGFEDETKVFEVTPKKDVRESFSLRRRVEPYGFVDYIGTPKAPIGLMFGHVKRWGWYLAAKFAPKTWTLSIKDDKNNSDYSLYNLYNKNLKHPSGDDVDWDQFDKKYTNQWDITGGVMARVFEGGYVFVGGGYGRGETLYLLGEEDQAGAMLFTDEKDGGKGPVAQIGLMIRLGQSFNFLGGYNMRFASSKMKGEPMWGLGISFYL